MTHPHCAQLITMLARLFPVTRMSDGGNIIQTISGAVCLPYDCDDCYLRVALCITGSVWPLAKPTIATKTQ